MNSPLDRLRVDEERAWEAYVRAREALTKELANNSAYKSALQQQIEDNHTQAILIALENNNRNVWTSSELDKLKAMTKDGRSYRQSAMVLGRTRASCMHKMHLLRKQGLV